MPGIIKPKTMVATRMTIARMPKRGMASRFRVWMIFCALVCSFVLILLFLWFGNFNMVTAGDKCAVWPALGAGGLYQPKAIRGNPHLVGMLDGVFNKSLNCLGGLKRLLFDGGLGGLGLALIGLDDRLADCSQ